jgi:hypothetical protein
VWRQRNSERLERLSLGPVCPGSWLATESPMVSPTLAAAIGEGLRGEAAHSRRDGEAARNASFLVAGSTFDRKARLEFKGGISLVESDDVGRRCSRGLLVGEIHPSSDFGPGGCSMRGGRAAGGRVYLLGPSRPARPAFIPRGGGRRAGLGGRLLIRTDAP